MSDEKVYWDYYKQAFLHFHIELENLGVMRQLYLIERRKFWKSIPLKEYEYEEATMLLSDYSRQLEIVASNIISQKSFLYWIHVYRRIAPAIPKPGATILDILNTRRIMEIAFQKYGKQGFCSHIARSKQIAISQIFNGLLLTEDYSTERRIIEKAPDMLVLTDFGVNELKEIYELEKICLEIHLVNKMYRILGKGCKLNYINANEWYNFTITNDAVKLMQIYDNRINLNKVNSSYLGVYYSNISSKKPDSYCLFPTYNVGNISFDNFKEIFAKLYKMEFTCLVNDCPNFVFYEFDIRSYYLAHKEASESFYETNKISFEALLCVIYFFFSVVFSDFKKPEFLLNYLFRGYSIRSKKDIIRNLENNKTSIKSKIGINNKEISRKDFEDAINFLSFSNKNRNLLDLSYCSLYFPFYEVSNNLLIDYSWMFKTFLTLFFKLKMDDQNFKGTILENSLKTSESILPTDTIKAQDGTEHQIDYSFMKDDVLFILECKVVSMSLAYERGDKKAVDYRTVDVVERALTEIDIKADWLIKHKEIILKYVPQAKCIVPIGVSAFVEYMPSIDKRYWLTDEIPRVLLPKEVEFIKTNPVNILYNKIKI
ncbi:MAG: hypothetical protein J6X78_07990 [Treponema sp.]|nr:hypothetical protein [Treponema sp.]